MRWGAKWGMEFQIAKCKVMHVHTLYSIGAKTPNHKHTMHGQELEVTEEEKDI